jgi:hypothetical protein
MGPSIALTAISTTEFSAPGLNLKFEKDASGSVPAVLFQAVEGDFKALRK